jgi:putative flippase GtrA
MLAQFIKFAVVGVLNTAIHYGVFYALYRFAGVYHLVASGAGFCAAVTHSYILNKFWTFKRRGSRVHEEFLKFFLVSLLSLCVNLTGMAILVELLAVHPPLAQLVTIGITLVLNFLGNRFWTFRFQPGLNS